MSATLRVLRPDEADSVTARAEVSFGASEDLAEATEVVRRRLEAGEYVGLDVDGTVLAQCRLSTVDHWFGGRRVPCQHVASVAVAPEHRGRGAARQLMAMVIQQGAGARAGLSLLFPATSRPYRSAGYEHAGMFSRYRVAARNLPSTGPALRPLDADRDQAAIRRCHERAASRLQGPEVRPDWRWQRLLRARFAYGLDADNGDELEGFLLADHQHTPGDWQYRLVIRDWAAVTPAAFSAVVGFVGSHGSFGRDAVFRSPVPEPWTLLAGEQDVEQVSNFAWMARGLHLPTAIGRRGFPAGLAATVSFAVDDPLLGAARGPWTLQVAAGRGRLLPASRADVGLHVRAFGPLYTGYHDPATLSLAGLLHGPDDACRRLGEIFAGPLPLLFDFF